jgi:dihydroorotate dehydrogenase (fumarate)
MEHLKACEDAGAGAVVLKSLFEEQIISDAGKETQNLDPRIHAEAWDYSRVMSEEYVLDSYLKLVEDAKKELSIPVIASLNCVSAGKWIDYADRFEQIGADALELNTFVVPTDERLTSDEIESVYFHIIEKIKQKVSIPVSLKIGHHFSGMAHVMKEFVDRGVDGLVLFNRFYRPDVDIESLELVPANVLSVPQEMTLPLQWIALMSGRLQCDFSATTGIHDSGGVVKQLLVGAQTVQLCTILLKNGVDYINVVLTGLENWMKRHNFSSVGDFRAKLCQENVDNPAAFERSQYIKALVGIE